MRTYCLLLSLLFISTATNSQIPAGVLSPEDSGFNASYSNRIVPKVTGKLLHLSPGEQKTLSISYSLVTPFSKWQVEKMAIVQPDGSFRLSLNYAFPYQQIWFSVGELFFTGLIVNKDLYLELDMKKIKSAKKTNLPGDGIRYIGTDGPMNTYLNHYVLYKSQEKQAIVTDLYTVISSSRAHPGKFPARYDSLYDSLKRIRDSYISSNPSPYSWILVNEQQSDYYANMLTMYFGNTMPDSLLQTINHHKSYLVSNNGQLFYRYIAMYIEGLPGTNVYPDWTDVAKLSDLDNTEKSIIDSLRESQKLKPAFPYTPENVATWEKKLEPRMEKIGFFGSLDRNIYKIDSLFPPAKADFLKLKLNIGTDLNNQKLAMDHILSSMHTGWCATVLKNEDRLAIQKINEINTTLARSAGNHPNAIFGKPLFETSFGASLYLAPAVKAIDFIAKLKQAYPGKAILIDRWATWCGPCLGEMPHSKVLQQSSKGIPIVFVYLCTVSGSSESKWKTKVVEIQQPGIHFLIDAKLDAELSNYFSFSGYPGYALLDRKGVYRPGAITRVSEINDREALAELIGK